MESNSPGPNQGQPVWLLAAALLLDIGAHAESWTEARQMRHFAAILALLGVGFVLSSYFPERSIILSISRVLRPPALSLVPAFRVRVDHRRSAASDGLAVPLPRRAGRGGVLLRLG